MNEIIRGLRLWGYHPHIDNDLGRIRIRLPHQQNAVYVGAPSPADAMANNVVTVI